MQESFTKVLFDLLLVLASGAIGLLIKWLSAKIGTEKISVIETTLKSKKEYAILAVQLVEQIYKDLDGPDKYSKASMWLAEQLTDSGIKVTVNEIQGLIESTVKELKSKVTNETTN